MRASVRRATRFMVCGCILAATACDQQQVRPPAKRANQSMASERPDSYHTSKQLSKNESGVLLRPPSSPITSPQAGGRRNTLTTTTNRRFKQISGAEAIRIGEQAVREERYRGDKTVRFESAARYRARRWFVFVVRSPPTAYEQNNLVEVSEEGSVLLIHPGE
jgi:hypothetical protein